MPTRVRRAERTQPPPVAGTARLVHCYKTERSFAVMSAKGRVRTSCVHHHGGRGYLAAISGAHVLSGTRTVRARPHMPSHASSDHEVAVGEEAAVAVLLAERAVGSHGPLERDRWGVGDVRRGDVPGERRRGVIAIPRRREREIRAVVAPEVLAWRRAGGQYTPPVSTHSRPEESHGNPIASQH